MRFSAHGKILVESGRGWLGVWHLTIGSRPFTDLYSTRVAQDLKFSRVRWNPRPETLVMKAWSSATCYLLEPQEPQFFQLAFKTKINQKNGNTIKSQSELRMNTLNRLQAQKTWEPKLRFDIVLPLPLLLHIGWEGGETTLGQLWTKRWSTMNSVVDWFGLTIENWTFCKILLFLLRTPFWTPYERPKSILCVASFQWKSQSRLTVLMERPWVTVPKKFPHCMYRLSETSSGLRKC